MSAQVLTCANAMYKRMTAGTNVQGPDSAEFAMELLRFPIRQVFGDTSVAPGNDAFVATITGLKMVDRFSLAQTVLGRNP